jgi:hypothetical protein
MESFSFFSSSFIPQNPTPVIITVHDEQDIEKSKKTMQDE